MNECDNPRHAVSVPDSQRDAGGFLYMDDGDGSGAWRLTECCQASVTYHDTTLCCKCCWWEVDDAYAEPARFDGDPVTVTPPTVIDLSGMPPTITIHATENDPQAWIWEDGK